MCGIVGALAFNNSNFEVDENYILKMRDTMVHRGPDGGGLWISSDRKVGLGHRRLSIIDLSAAADQPMCNEDGTLWIVFNGEIYNHAEIRKELMAIGGHVWKTDHSDTEMILHAFEQWGIDCIHKFRGMFAIGLWDASKSELWLIRDRMGVKPLYYSIHDGRIVFASEIKALLKDPGQKRVLNEAAAYHYLSFLTAPAPSTLFEGIKKLPNASWLKISCDGTLRQSKYWDMLDNASSLADKSENEIAAMILEELRTSVKLRKISDVPVGVFLSGGIDSSTNAALFSEGETTKVKTFSIGYEGEYSSYKNELYYARKIAGLVGAEHHEKLLTQKDLMEFLPEMIHLQDEPIGDPVCFPVYFVSKLARDNGVVVCQLGEGADELFCGYPGWKTSLHLQKIGGWPIPTFLKSAVMHIASIWGNVTDMKFEKLRRNINDQPVFWGGADEFSEFQKKRLLSKRMKKQFKNFTSWEPVKKIYSAYKEKARDNSILNWMTYLDLNFRLPELLLMRVDKMAMGVSLEARVPFLDHKFVELAMGIPEKIKTRNGVLKYILKKAVRGVIPDEIIDRPKQGFGVPVREWLFSGLGAEVKREIKDFCAKTDYFDNDEMTKYIETSGLANSWYIYNFVLWWKKNIYS
ncbi:MAG TPA: asparagine synthase (glutamine-hydrolyzing) [Candidatus Wallbacteria bacterium]|nr:MAG: Asparagine synthetase (glutamine-hydrolyzing) 1 [bacterium ADurb.Bin243]HPG57148.1 asparagine synthase (glutamine-hydrolyzing) [Candidatus Wallbacteria bacterium]